MATDHHRRTGGQTSDGARRRLASLAHRGLGRAIGNGRVRRLIKEGDALGMTAGDTVVVATEMLLRLDEHRGFPNAIEELLGAFDSGALVTGFREPLNQYLDRSAVAALAVAACAECRPNIPIHHSDTIRSMSAESVPEAPAVATFELDSPEPEPEESQQNDQIAHWPDRTPDGEPRMILNVRVWWPDLTEWEEATFTASVKGSLVFGGDHFMLWIEQEGDASPAKPNAVWLVKRDDLDVGLPVYELRASVWEPGDEESHRYRFLFASPSAWADELHDYLATRWISEGESPAGPDEFAEPYAADPPHILLAPTR